MELELTVTLDDDAKGEHCSQFSFSVDYDGDGVESAFLCSASPKFKIEGGRRIFLCGSERTFA